MSRSTNASKGTPDDDDGRLSEQTPAEADGAAADDAVEDAVTDEAPTPDDMTGQVESGADETDAEDEADEREPAAAATGAGSKGARSASASSAAAATKVPVKKSPAKAASKSKEPQRRGPIAAIVLFVRQVISELRKVVTPTGKELGTYVAVVIVFVLIVMAYVGVLDLAFGRLVLWAFGG